MLRWSAEEKRWINHAQQPLAGAELGQAPSAPPGAAFWAGIVVGILAGVAGAAALAPKGRTGV